MVAQNEKREQLLTDEDLCSLLKVKRRTVWKYVKEVPNFPQPVKILGATRFKQSEVSEFLSKLGK